MPRISLVILSAWLVSLVYATARYVVFGPVELAQFPVYVLNKAAAFTGLVLLVAARFAREPADRQQLGRIGACSLGLHTMLTLMILRPAYFPRFFGVDEKMTGLIELSMLAGAAGLGLLAVISRSASQPKGDGCEIPARRIALLSQAVLATAAVHVALMGYPGWRTPGQWPGGLPPITLLSFMVAIVGLLAFRRRT